MEQLDIDIRQCSTVKYMRMIWKWMNHLKYCALISLQIKLVTALVHSLYIAMKSDSNWFQSPLPKANFYHFTSKEPDHDDEPSHKPDPYSPEPLPFLRSNLTPKELSPWSKILNADSDNKEEHLSIAGILPSDYRTEGIDQRLVFSEDEDDEDQVTPIKHEQNNKYDNEDEELLTTGKKSLFQPLFPTKKSRPREKGLRKLSQRAYQIVQELKNATYKEVAAKLVQELNDDDFQSQTKQEQNIKRRVYDALNVLIALGVLRKDGRKIISDRPWKNREANQHGGLELLRQKLKLKTALVQQKIKKRRQAQAKMKTVQTLLYRNRDQNYSSDVTVPFPFIGIIIEYESIKEDIEFTPGIFGVTSKLILQPFGDMDCLKWLDDSLHQKQHYQK